MRIAIVGPAHPYKGGIAQHTTELAHQLEAAGHTVQIISWRSQYPFFYPGEQFVPGGQPETKLYAATKRVLSWKNPIGWSRWGRHLRQFDRLIFIWWVPTIQGPVYLEMLRAIGKQRPPITLICHNVLPHEPKPGDKQLTRAVLGRVDKVIVHSSTQAVIAKALTTAEIQTVNLPLVLLNTSPVTAKKNQAAARQLLFFGVVRPYKGVDVLLKALAQVPDVKLTIAGEFWGGTKAYKQLIDELGLKERVVIESGYVESTELARLIAEADAIVLPYREGTASWNVSLAHAYGTPVIATTVGSMGTQLKDGVDGLLCAPNDTSTLAATLRRFYKPGTAAKLRAGIPHLTTDSDWKLYVNAVTRD